LDRVRRVPAVAVPWLVRLILSGLHPSLRVWLPCETDAIYRSRRRCAYTLVADPHTDNLPCLCIAAKESCLRGTSLNQYAQPSRINSAILGLATSGKVAEHEQSACWADRGRVSGRCVWGRGSRVGRAEPGVVRPGTDAGASRRVRATAGRGQRGHVELRGRTRWGQTTSVVDPRSGGRLAKLCPCAAGACRGFRGVRRRRARARAVRVGAGALLGGGNRGGPRPLHRASDRNPDRRGRALLGWSTGRVARGEPPRAGTRRDVGGPAAVHDAATTGSDDLELGGSRDDLPRIPAFRRDRLGRLQFRAPETVGILRRERSPHRPLRVAAARETP